MCHNVSTIYDKKYVIHKLTRITHGYLFQANGEVTETLPECSLRCITSKCATWWYDEFNLLCYTFQEYGAIGVKAAEIHDAIYIWSTIYDGKPYDKVIFTRQMF